MTSPSTPTVIDTVWETLASKLGLSLATKKGSTAVSATWNSRSLLAGCEDGHRTAHLVRLAGTCFARGFSSDQVIEHCLMWNERNNPPLDEGKVISTCESIGAADARNHPDRDRNIAFSLQETVKPATPMFDVVDARIDRYLATPPPPQRWVLDGFLPLGIVAAIVAPGGTGKSQLLMQLAYSVATGAPLAGFWPVGESGTVLMLCAEDSENEIHRRISRIDQQLRAGMTQAQRTALEKHFLVRSLVGEDVLLTQTIRNNEVVRTQLADRLLLTAQQVTDLKLIIIDPASRFRGGDENSNLHATRFVQALEYLALNTGATVLIAHHSGKGAMNTGEVTQTASRGASALTDGIRWQLALTPLTSIKKGYESVPSDLRHHHLEAKLVKSNYTAPKASVLLRREDDGYLAATDVTASGPSIKRLAQIIKIIAELPNGITARQFEISYGGLKKELKIPERDVRKLLESARDLGLLSGERRQPLKITGAATPWLKSQQAVHPMDGDSGQLAANPRAARKLNVDNRLDAARPRTVPREKPTGTST